MDNNYLVSIIVPNYCHAKYLDQRIQSILNQTCQNFELIILDDCSPDNGASKAVIEKYRNNSHVSHIVYNETNSGSTFKQWDKGIKLARGKFIWIAESDDFCEPNLLEELFNQVEVHPSCSLVYALSQQVDENGNAKGCILKSHANKYMKGTDFIRRYMCCENPVYNASSAIFSREIALAISPVYKEYVGAGDRLFWIEIAEKGDVAIVNKPLNYFRQHDSKVTPKRALDGTNLREAHRTYEYMAEHHVFSWFRKYAVRGYYQSLVMNTKFSSETIREELNRLWGNKQGKHNLAMIVGRAIVSMRYHFHLYL